MDRSQYIVTRSNHLYNLNDSLNFSRILVVSEAVP